MVDGAHLARATRARPLACPLPLPPCLESAQFGRDHRKTQLKPLPIWRNLPMISRHQCGQNSPKSGRTRPHSVEAMKIWSQPARVWSKPPKVERTSLRAEQFVRLGAPAAIPGMSRIGRFRKTEREIEIRLVFVAPRLRTFLLLLCRTRHSNICFSSLGIDGLPT